MKFTQEDLKWLVEQNVISHDQSVSLWDALAERNESKPILGFSNVLYYAGALLIICAMTWFMTLGWEKFGGTGIFALSASYMILFMYLGKRFWSKQQFKIPGGLLFTVAVSITPLAIYGLEKAFDVWPQVSAHDYSSYHSLVMGTWFWMELGTILVGLITLKYIRFPFLTAPIAFTLWYMSMDMTPLLFGQKSWTWEQYQYVSIFFGALMLLGAYCIDRKTKEDFAFWMYQFGLFSFWFGASSFIWGKPELWQSLWCLLNVSLFLCSVLLKRKVFLVFGSLGILGYLGHLSYELFKDSYIFPFVVSIIGLGIIFAGVFYQKNQEKIERFILRVTPSTIINLLPQNR